MSLLDWLVLALTIFLIVAYGIWKSRGSRNIDGFLLADKQLPWYQVGLSVMATQASAITFLSVPGQAYTDGLRFVQFYFGLPFAMVVLCITFIPMYRKLNVFTAYEFLEKRFDNKTRSLTALLFLLQRGLSTGLTIYAPSIILSVILGIDIFYTTIFMGGIVILYTAYGGTKAVSYTQMLQMCIIFAGLFMSAYMVLNLLPPEVGFFDVLHIAGKMDRLNAIDPVFDFNNKYNVWSGIIGGFFLHLSYFGSDQSQVGRYLTGESDTESRFGLIMNGLLKIPMQFLILFIGILVFVFYQFHTPPLFFNRVEEAKIQNSVYSEEYAQLGKAYKSSQEQKRVHVNALLEAVHQKDENGVEQAKVNLQEEDRKSNEIRKSVTALMEKNDAEADIDDCNYIFLTFVTQQLPVGVVGLLIAVILLAAMGATASGLNSLASTTVIDFYKRLVVKEAEEHIYLLASRWATVGWGLFCIIVALYASKLGNLVEAINVLGSLFYGTILGIFLVAFYMKKIGGTAVFLGAILTECFVVYAWKTELMTFLWLNVVGCLAVMGSAWIVQNVWQLKEKGSV